MQTPLNQSQRTDCFFGCMGGNYYCSQLNSSNWNDHRRIDSMSSISIVPYSLISIMLTHKASTFKWQTFQCWQFECWELLSMIPVKFLSSGFDQRAHFHLIIVIVYLRLQWANESACENSIQMCIFVIQSNIYI